LKGEDHKLDNAVNGLLNMLLLSIPEGLVISFICLLLLNDKNMLDLIKIKKNLKNYIILILPQAFALNFVEFILGINNLLVKFLVGHVIIVGCLTIINKKFRIVTLGVVAICYVISSFSEIILVFPLLKIFNLTVDYINSNIICKFLVFIPQRLIQLIILFAIILRFNIDLSNNIIYFILRNKVLRVVFFVVIGLNIYEFIKNVNYIVAYIPQSANTINFTIYIIKQLACPIFNILAFVFIINYFRKTIKKSVSETNIEVK